MRAGPAHKLSSITISNSRLAYHANQTLPFTTARVWEVKSSHIERYMQECLSQPTIVH